MMSFSTASSITSASLSLPHHPNLHTPLRFLTPPPPKNLVSSGCKFFVKKRSKLPSLKSTFSTKFIPHPLLKSKPINFLEELSPTKKSEKTTITKAKKSYFDKQKEKPEWKWRSIASIFYLKPFLQFGGYGIFEPAFKLSPILKNFGELTWERHIRFIACFPQWIWYIYHIGLYFGARRKELPHYLRFHMINGLLIDVGLEILVYVNKWFPYSWLWSKVGTMVLGAIGIAYVVTILECVRCALFGRYANVPFVSEASLIHTHG